MIWFASAFTYYGVVLLNTELLLLESAGDHCPDIYYIEPSPSTVPTPLQNATNVTTNAATVDNCVRLEADHYADAFVDSVAEHQAADEQAFASYLHSARWPEQLGAGRFATTGPSC